MYEEFANRSFIENEAKYSKVYSYLDRYIDDSTKYYLPVNDAVEVDRTIWVMWYQGLDNAPLIVRKCVDSIKKHIPKGYNLVIITEQNIKDYVDVPEHVEQAFLKGSISHTHFSDLVRLYLLVSYGGLWIDSTVYICDDIPAFMYDGFFVFSTASAISEPIIKNSSWWISAKKDDYTLRKTLLLLENYWRNEKELIEYYLVHIAIAKVVNEDPMARAEFNRIPFFSNLNAHYLNKILNNNFSEEEYKRVKQISPIQKLSYKRRCIRGDMFSFYSYILSD